MKKTCWLIVLCLLWSSPAAAETVIRFKSGKTLSGELLDRNPETIRIRFAGMELSFGMAEVESVDGQPVAPAPAVTEKPAALDGGTAQPAASAEKVKAADLTAPPPAADEPEPRPTPPPGARPGQTRPRGVDTTVKKAAPVKTPVVEEAAVPKVEAAPEPAPSTPMPAAVSPAGPAAQEEAGPGEVYAAYLDAVRAGDWERIKSYVTGEQIQQIEETFAKEGGVDQVVQMLQLMMPTDLEIVAERVRGDDATILASGQVLDKLSRGAITLSRATGRWLIKKEEWKSDDTPLLQ